MKENEEDLMKVLTSKGAMEVLRYIYQHNEFRREDLKEFCGIRTLDIRLQELSSLGLIQRLERGQNRVEGYSLTDRGKKVLQVIESLLHVVED
jgi:DNA-binding HxlR family transcriptional regulator